MRDGQLLKNMKYASEGLLIISSGMLWNKWIGRWDEQCFYFRPVYSLRTRMSNITNKQMRQVWIALYDENDDYFGEKWMRRFLPKITAISRNNGKE